MTISDTLLAKLLVRFLEGGLAARIARERGIRTAIPIDYAGEIYCALCRQRFDEIADANQWVAVNASWHLKNSIRRELTQSLSQPAPNEVKD